MYVPCVSCVCIFIEQLTIVVYFQNHNVGFVSKDREVTHDVAEEDEYPAEEEQLAEDEREDDEPSEIHLDDGERFGFQVILISHRP